MTNTLQLLTVIAAWRATVSPKAEKNVRPINNHKNPFLFRDAMLRLIHSDNLEYKELMKVA
jgi:hypothetical protein